MKWNRVLPGLALGIAILILGPLRTHYRFEYQAAALFALALVTVGWLVIARRRGAGMAASPIDAPLIALVIAFTIATVASQEPRRSMGQVQLLLAHVLLFWIVFDLVSSGGPQASSLKLQPRQDAGDWKLEAWSYGLLAASGVVLLLAVAEVESWYLLWWRLGGAAHPLPPFSYRLTSWLGHASGFSALVAACVPLALIALLRSRRAAVRVVLGLWLFGALVGLVFASSRAGWLGIGAGVGTLALILAAERRRNTLSVEAGGDRSRKPPSSLGEPIRPGSSRTLLVVAIGVLVFAGAGWLVLQTFRDPTHAPILLARAELWPPAWQAFLSSPWVGTGPATFYLHFLAANPLSQHTFLTQAHSVPFSLLAEEGLIGTAAAGLVILTGLFAAGRSIRSSTPSESRWRWGALAGMAALGVHALTDNAATTPPVSFVQVVLAALLLSGPAVTLRKRPAWVGALLLLLMLAYGAFTLPAHLAFRHGLERARAGDASGAALALDQAASKDPQFPWYTLQAGFAHGTAALEDSSELASATEMYATGIQLDPAYSLHRLNQAWLYWQGGDHPNARAEISRAAQVDPSPLVLLNWGWMLESDGEVEAARRQYQAALDADERQADAGYATPHGSIADLSHSLFWETRPLRLEALAAWSPQAQPSAYPMALEAAHRSLEAGDLPTAREGFQTARELDPFRPEAFRGMGLTATRAGDIGEARYYFEAASLARGSAFERMLAFLDLMELEAGASRNPEAVRSGLRAFDLLEAYNSWGMGSDHANPYAWGVFYRESLPDDLLRWVLRPDVSADLADRLLKLASLLNSTDDRAQACRVILRVLRAAPEYESARSESGRLGCAP